MKEMTIHCWFHDYLLTSERHAQARPAYCAEDPEFTQFLFPETGTKQFGESFERS